MRKFIIVLVALCSLAVSAEPFEVVRQGNVFRERLPNEEIVETPYYWHDRDGYRYKIHLSEVNVAFIFKKDEKTGKTERQYLGERVSRIICKEMKRKYGRRQWKD